MITKQTVEYIDFDDVEKFICDELGIPVEKFRDYHEVIGGDYKDWWHVWMTLNYDAIDNNSYVRLWVDIMNWKGAVKEYGEWVNVLRPIVDKMFCDDESLLIYYSW